MSGVYVGLELVDSASCTTTIVVPGWAAVGVVLAAAAPRILARAVEARG